MGLPLTPAPPPGNEVGMVQGPLGPDVSLTQWHAQQQQRYNQVTGLANLLNWAATSGRLPQDVADIAGGQYLRFLGEKDPFKALPKYTQWLQETIQAHGIGSNARQGQQAPGIVQPGPQPPPGAPPGAPQALAAPTQFSQSQPSVPPPPGTGPAALPATPNGQIGPTALPLQSQPQTTVAAQPPQQTTVAPSVPPPPGSNMTAPTQTGFGIGRENEVAYQANLASAIALAQARAQAAGRTQEISDRARMVESDPNLQGLAPFQKASIIYGQFMPVPIRSMAGDIMTASQAASQNAVDMNGRPVDPNSKDFYRGFQTTLPDGTWGLMVVPTQPTSSTTFTTDVPDASSSTGYSKQVTPRSGGGPIASAPNVIPSMATTTRTKDTPVNIGGSTVVMPMGETVKKTLPGQTPAPPPGSAPQAQPQGMGAAAGPRGLTHTLTPEQVRTTQEPMFDAQNRLMTMTQNLTDALASIKSGKVNQQAMLSLLANHMGMTTGAVRGMRTGRDLINEAEQSAPALGRIEARFSPEGYLTGVTLTPEQMHQMVGLAITKYLNTRQQVGQQMQAAGTNTKFPDIPPNVMVALGIPKSAMNPPPGKSLVISNTTGIAGLYPTDKLPNTEYVEVK